MGLAILFSGQGSHHPGMFDLLKRYKKLTPYMETASRFTGLSFREIDDLSKEKVLKNKYDQTLLCTLSYALWQGLSPILPTPVLFAGFSLGELCCYASAGCIGFQKLLRLSKSRAALMAQASPQNIKVAAVIGVPLKELKNECERFNCYIMIISGPAHATVGGIAKKALYIRLFPSTTIKVFFIITPKVYFISKEPLIKRTFEHAFQQERIKNRDNQTS